MTISPAPVDVLPDPRPIIDNARPDTAGGAFAHVYAATGKHTVDVPLTGPADVDRAIAAARAAHRDWKHVAPPERRKLLNALADSLEAHFEEMVSIQVTENGIPWTIASGHVLQVIEMLRYAAGWPDKLTGDVNAAWPGPALDYSVLEPYGVVGIIVPWNSALFCLGSVLGAALAAGNCVVIKPPEFTPFTTLRLIELAIEAGFPPGVLNVVPGDGAVGAALVEHPGIDKIHFTGSGATATRILQSAAVNLTPVATELGGKSPNIIFDDADLDAASFMALAFCMQVSGQGCINGTRILVQDSVHDEVVARLEQNAAMFAPGDPRLPETMFGPVINQAAIDRITGFIERAKDASAGTLVTGGSRAAGDFADGFYLEPTIFADVDPASEIARTEIFGPVMAVIRFTDEADALDKANDTDFGLASYIQTTNLGRAHRMAAELDAGMVWINGLGFPPSIPFGGVKQSGTGRSGGLAGIHEFSRTKNVWISL
ncbi:aldehyde dehydrogenase family protein [Gordonia amarae]|uniref:Aldehyde dehydrogenase family protein n=2 Tax=Gordonia amarae TaxID=36821 RepID=A0A857L2Q2_9ACTN|nr:aldehyde dehydrogenase family protein [Gordonia amarae]MCS3880703.1 acyl-CoA reductase-like NAD-dependent aldehyde dehydrogenase [Gordonia amarae]QHN18999.1 aldehyde dehydrogenase family protein [Gordonia amarae]QHN23474.1 aldehyde dehydrogenase family protein [Gordonia amarae]QHN32374.1 aldehyde dehydrogenase family protein [Gordonia amarae]QHN41122.1 aldehyde dehydrogenase family protein [Gordonia amarae]